jgi:TrmH family RNA methyltransferase
MTVTGLSKARWGALRRVARGKVPDEMLVEGPQAAAEAVAALRGWPAHGHLPPVPPRPGSLRQLLVTPAAAERHAALVADAEALGVPTAVVGEAELAELTATVTPQGVVAVAAVPWVPAADVLGAGPVPAAPRTFAVLAEVRDPGNAGTVIRCADASGASGVLATAGSVDLANTKCVRASVGSVFHLPIAVRQDFAALAEALRAAGVVLLAADGHGDIATDELLDDAAAGRGPLVGDHAWVFGNEAWGMPAPRRAVCDAVVAIPPYGRAESLNLATASAVCLFASARARRAGLHRPVRPGLTG